MFYSNFLHKTHRFWHIRLQKCRDLEKRVRVCQGHWKYHDSIERIWLPILTFHSNHRFWDRRWFQSTIIAKFSTPLYFAPPLNGCPLELCNGTGVKKLEWWSYVWIQCTNVTDGQTPGDSKDRAYAWSRAVKTVEGLTCKNRLYIRLIDYTLGLCNKSKRI